MAVDYEEGRRLLAEWQLAGEALADSSTEAKAWAAHDARLALEYWLRTRAEALLNPVSAAPSPAPDEVEAVARAINPRAWDVMDYELRETQKKYAGQNVAWSVSQFQHAESMDQARAAIAALRPTNQEPRND